MLTNEQLIQFHIIASEMRKTLDPKRFEHTMGVVYTAGLLATVYGCDEYKAKTAGLLHDSAKCLNDTEYLEICAQNGITVSDVEKRHPFLLHGKVGAFFARTRYDINDPEILDAIICHTTGKTDMSMLDKIIFIADYIEPGRDRAPGLAELRRLAFKDIDYALINILSDTIDYLKNDCKSEIDETTLNTYNYYRNILSQM